MLTMEAEQRPLCQYKVWTHSCQLQGLPRDHSKASPSSDWRRRRSWNSSRFQGLPLTMLPFESPELPSSAKQCQLLWITLEMAWTPLKKKRKKTTNYVLYFHFAYQSNLRTDISIPPYKTSLSAKWDVTAPSCLSPFSGR